MSAGEGSVVGCFETDEPGFMKCGPHKRRTCGLRGIIAAALVIDALVLAMVWPRSSISGRAGEPDQGSLIVARVVEGDGLPESCAHALIDYATGRIRQGFAGGFPTRKIFERRAAEALSEYVSMDCPAGPFLAVRAASTDMARAEADEARGSWAFWGRP